MPSRSFNDVIEKVLPLVKKAIEVEHEMKYKTPEEQEAGQKRFEALMNFQDELWQFPKHLVDFNSANVTDNLYEAVPVSDEKFEEFLKKFLEITA